MADIAKQLGSRIQKLRKMRGLTQSQLAESIGVETVTISRIENGQRFPQKDNLENITKVLNVKIQDLFNFEQNLTKDEIIKNINQIINSAELEDLNYIHKMIQIYFDFKP